MSDVQADAVYEVAVPNPEGLHARPVMHFVDLASKYKSAIRVINITRGQERIDGKSAMDMMLLEATKGCVLRIEARGDDAKQAVEALVNLIRTGGIPDEKPPVSGDRA